MRKEALFQKEEKAKMLGVLVSRLPGMVDVDVNIFRTKITPSELEKKISSLMRIYAMADEEKDAIIKQQDISPDTKREALEVMQGTMRAAENSAPRCAARFFAEFYRMPDIFIPLLDLMDITRKRLSEKKGPEFAAEEFLPAVEELFEDLKIEELSHLVKFLSPFCELIQACQEVGGFNVLGNTVYYCPTLYGIAKIELEKKLADAFGIEPKADALGIKPEALDDIQNNAEQISDRLKKISWLELHDILDVIHLMDASPGISSLEKEQLDKLATSVGKHKFEKEEKAHPLTVAALGTLRHDIQLIKYRIARQKIIFDSLWDALFKMFGVQSKANQEQLLLTAAEFGELQYALDLDLPKLKDLLQQLNDKIDDLSEEEVALIKKDADKLMKPLESTGRGVKLMELVEEKFYPHLEKLINHTKQLKIVIDFVDKQVKIIQTSRDADLKAKVTNLSSILVALNYFVELMQAQLKLSEHIKKHKAGGEEGDKSDLEMKKLLANEFKFFAQHAVKKIAKDYPEYLSKTYFAAVKKFSKSSLVANIEAFLSEEQKQQLYLLAGVMVIITVLHSALEDITRPLVETFLQQPELKNFLAQAEVRYDFLTFCLLPSAKSDTYFRLWWEIYQAAPTGTYEESFLQEHLRNNSEFLAWTEEHVGDFFAGPDQAVALEKVQKLIQAVALEKVQKLIKEVALQELQERSPAHGGFFDPRKKILLGRARSNGILENPKQNLPDDSNNNAP
ncbi:MAG: hypothetical protein A3F17_00990 [Gammaproteobacteria bacterium RIFCSPHIGHO2_12_FULL_41_15]|nr:MAG: hypothetical protein A3F17_00990 [Gammaproteobacteria bacterium RIFCSPHIGHO2_12_FULL_41_15]